MESKARCVLRWLHDLCTQSNDEYRRNATYIVLRAKPCTQWHDASLTSDGTLVSRSHGFDDQKGGVTRPVRSAKSGASNSGMSLFT